MWIRKTNEVFGMLSLCVEAFTDSDAEADVNQKWFHNMSMRYDLKSMKQKAHATSWNSWSVVSWMNYVSAVFSPRSQLSGKVHLGEWGNSIL